jgi:hypothetical protein
MISTNGFENGLPFLGNGILRNGNPDTPNQAPSVLLFLPIATFLNGSY